MSKKTTAAFIPLFLIIFIDSMGYFLIIPVLLRLIMEVGQGVLPIYVSESMRNFIFGIAVALSPFAYLVAAPIIGTWSDKWGRKKTMFICLVGSCVGFLLPVFGVAIGSLIIVLIGRALAGAASSSQPIAQAAVTDITSGKQKAFYLSIIAFAMTLAMVTGPLLGSYLSDSHIVPWFNNTTPFLAAALLVFVTILMLMAFFRETNLQSTAHGILTFKETWWALTAAFSDKRVRILLLVFFIYEFAWSLYFQDISLYLTQGYHYSPNQIAIFIAYSGTWMSLGLTVLYHFIVRYLSLSACLTMCFIVAMLSLLACGFSYSATAQWIFIIPMAISVGMAYPTLLAMLSNRVTKEHQGWIMGVSGSILALSWMLTAIITGSLTNIYLSLPLQVAAFAMIIAVGTLYVWMLHARNSTTVSCKP